MQLFLNLLYIQRARGRVCKACKRPGDARGLLLNGCLYLCDPAQVSVTDPEGMKVLATVSNAVG